ncbi:MAG: hypothetical protein HXS52_12805 [Theionarchaea archaeon]|nr:hypothetical protein [Theionarchaea archaeon]MBU7038804.1 hypothetical protein [Theionarchaea archaeon]
MKFPRVTDRRKQYCIILAVTIMWIVTSLYAAFHEDGHTYKMDVDGDGVKETVTEYRMITGNLYRLETEENGNVIEKFYRRNGTLIAKWLFIPDFENPEGYTIYVWDEKSQEWLLDQDQDGIPDSAEEIKSDHLYFLAIE